MIKEATKYAAQLTGEFYQNEVVVTEKPRQLPDDQAVFVKLGNPQILDDNSENIVEVFYGDRDRQRHRLQPGTDTELLPIRNLRDIFIKTKPGERGVVVFTIFR